MERIEYPNSLYFVEIEERPDGFYAKDNLGNSLLSKTKEELLKEIEKISCYIRYNNSRIADSLPETPWIDSSNIAHSMISDLNTCEKNYLIELIESDKDFDTGWGSTSKEFCDLRIVRSESKICIFVHNEMDDIPEIIYDAIPDGYTDELTEEKVLEIENILWNNFDFSTEVSLEKIVNSDIGLDELISEIAKMESESDTILEENFNACKSIVSANLK